MAPIAETEIGKTPEGRKTPVISYLPTKDMMELARILNVDRDRIDSRSLSFAQVSNDYYNPTHLDQAAGALRRAWTGLTVPGDILKPFGIEAPKELTRTELGNDNFAGSFEVAGVDIRIPKAHRMLRFSFEVASVLCLPEDFLKGAQEGDFLVIVLGKLDQRRKRTLDNIIVHRLKVEDEKGKKTITFETIWEDKKQTLRTAIRFFALECEIN